MHACHEGTQLPPALPAYLPACSLLLLPYTQHEVLEVTEGTRVALAFELFARPGA